MNCNVIKDLIPLYVDECCSEESALIVEEHVENCPECKRLYENMKKPLAGAPATDTYTPKKLGKINLLKASILQSVLFFVSFALITIGVALEAVTHTGTTNGNFSFSLVIPSTGFLLSLANWYFLRLYKSRKVFSNFSFGITLAITACAYIWAIIHYELNFLSALGTFFSKGLILTVLFCALSKILSDVYAKMIGKE